MSGWSLAGSLTEGFSKGCNQGVYQGCSHLRAQLGERVCSRLIDTVGKIELLGAVDWLLSIGQVSGWLFTSAEQAGERQAD